MVSLTPATPRPPLMLWLFIRVLSITVALLAFFISPDAERSAYPWKILAPWYSWDAHYYVDIVKNGYVPGRATANFHPLYPWLSSIVALIIREPLLSLLLVASLAGLLLTIAFYR